MKYEGSLPRQLRALQKKPRVLVAVVLFIAVIAGIGGYLQGMRNSQSIPPWQPSQSPQPTGTSQISATITQPSYNQFTPFLSPLPTNPLIAEIPNCTLTGHDAETEGWKTYTNTKHFYSFKYPTEANTVFNYKSNAPHDFNDNINIKDQNDGNWNPIHGRWITAFGLGIITLENYPEEFNYHKYVLKKVHKTIDEYTDRGLTYRQINILNQPAIIYELVSNQIIRISFIKDNVLYNINLSKEVFPLSCQILSTFKFTGQ